MATFKTVDGSVALPSDPLLSKQKEDVAKMRASLLCCSNDPYEATTAMQNITVLRIYHQMSRIIRYLEMMDKIENKLYEAIDSQLDRFDVDNPVTWMTLLNMQERLQKNLIESHKLLEPYINKLETLREYVSTVYTQQDVDTHGILTESSRDSLRAAAQAVLAMLPADEVTEENAT